MCVFNYALLWLKTHSFMPVMFSGKRLSAVASRNGVSFAFVCFMICIPHMNICSCRMYEIVRRNNRKNYYIYCTFFSRFYVFYCRPCTACPQKNFRLPERYRKQTRCAGTIIIFTTDVEVSQFAANDPGDYCCTKLPLAVTVFENQIWRKQESLTGVQRAFHTEPP